MLWNEKRNETSPPYPALSNGMFKNLGPTGMSGSLQKSGGKGVGVLIAKFEIAQKSVLDLFFLGFISTLQGEWVVDRRTCCVWWADSLDWDCVCFYVLFGTRQGLHSGCSSLPEIFVRSSTELYSKRLIFNASNHREREMMVFMPSWSCMRWFEWVGEWTDLYRSKQVRSFGCQIRPFWLGDGFPVSPF